MSTRAAAPRAPDRQLRGAAAESVRAAPRAPLPGIAAPPAPCSAPRCACGGGCPRCGSASAPPIVNDVLRTPGEPLPAAIRTEMEDRLAGDLSGVRVHRDDAAARSARAVAARAYTVGSHVVFGPGGWAPHQPEGQRLLAHELAHVAQQRDAPGTPAGPLTVGRRDDPLERDAERSAMEVQRPARRTGRGHARPALRSAAPGVLRRDPVEEQEAEVEAAEAQAVAGTPPVERRPDDPDRVGVSYAFFYTGGGYGDSAREFIRVFYPEHRRITASSFEQMFDELYADLQRHRRRDERLHVDEIVIVTHANSAGGLQIPLARDDVRRRRNFTPWDLAALQEEFQDRTHEAYGRRQRFRARRLEVVREAIDDDTSVVVRGCEFGQSEEGLEALRAFFGGHVYVWAPRVYQGYEVARIGGSHLASAAEAFDVLQGQDLIPSDLDLSDDEKAQYLARELGIRGSVPTEFFVLDQEAHDQLNARAAAGTALQEGAEHLKIREEVDVPSLGGAGYWGLSSPSALGEDPELDALPLAEIERRARLLHDNYRPEYAPMLLRLRDAWDRHPESLRRALEDTSGDPLAGLPPISIFGDSNLLVGDAARFHDVPTHDAFEDTELPFAPPAEGAEAAAEYAEGVAMVEEGAIEETPPDSEAVAEGVPAPEDAVAPIRAGGGPGPAPGPGGRGSGGSGRRRVATPAELARARSFDKDRPRAPETEAEAEPEIPAAMSDDEVIRAILEQLPEEGWQLSDYLSVADLSISVLTAPATFIEGGALVFAWEAAGLLAPLISIVGFFVTLDEAAEVHIQASRALGIRLGLDRLGGRVYSERFAADSISADDLYQGLSDDPEVISQIKYNIPFGGRHVLPNVRIGVQAVATSANRTMRNAERNLRQGLERGGLTGHDLELAYSSMIVEYRRQALMALCRAGFEAVRRRREALEARQD